MSIGRDIVNYGEHETESFNEEIGQRIAGGPKIKDLGKTNL